MKITYTHQLYKKYQALYQKLNKALQTGRFAHYSTQKKSSLLQRLERYERRLVQKGIAVAGVATLMLGTPMLQAQGALPLGPEFLVNTFTTNSQRNPSIGVDGDGDFVITWQSRDQDGSSYGIYAQRYASDGTPQGSEFPVNTFTTSNQRNPSIGVDGDGDFVITWQSFGQDGSGEGIYAQRYASDGTPLGSEFQVNTFTVNSQRNPSIGVDSDGDFVITWHSYGQDGSSDGIYARRYASDGTPQDSEFPVNTFNTSSQTFSSIGVDSDGDFVITWQSFQDGSGDGIYAQRYASDGTPQGSEFPVNTFTTSDQRFPSIGLDSDGDFVITWQSGSFSGSGQDGSGYGIYAQRYASDGTPLGGEFPVNTFTTSSQRNPSIGVDSDGDFVITWRSRNQDGDYYGVYAQRYASDGTPLGSEFQVNTFTTSNQTFPSIGVDSDGDFVIAWQSGSSFGSGQDGSDYGIYAQRYADALVPVELLSFEGKASDTGNLLEWRTASESDNKGFSVERSENGKVWKAIGFVEGNGTTIEQQQYAFVDKDIQEVLYYYRLKQIDFSGEYEYSDVLVLKSLSDAASTITVLPNPVQDRLQLNFSAELSPTATLRIINLQGKEVWRAASLPDVIDASTFAAGTYFLQVQTGQQVQQLKFVKL